MAHWLSEAEQEIQRTTGRGKSAGFLDRKMRVHKNFDKNKAKYSKFIDTLNDYIKRANSLPLEKKVPFGNIDSKFKETKLRNHLYVYKSSRRYQRKLITKFWERLMDLAFFSLFKPSHFKHIRVMYVTVSSKMDQVGFEIREESQLKQREVVDRELAIQRKYLDRNRFHEYINLEMDELSQELALQILDWLAFKEDLASLEMIKKLTNP